MRFWDLDDRCSSPLCIPKMRHTCMLKTAEITNDFMVVNREEKNDKLTSSYTFCRNVALLCIYNDWFVMLAFCDFRIVYSTTCTYGCSSSSCSKIISMNSCVHSWMSATREHLQCRPRHISFFCMQNEQQSSWSECAAVDGLLSHSQRRTTLAWQRSIQKEAIPYESLLWDSNLLLGSPKG